MGFSTDWLALREPADHAARDTALRERVVACVGPNAVVTDLGSGTGSTARAFTDPVCQSWTWQFVDADADLLAVAAKRQPASAQVQFDLRQIDVLDLRSTGLVTASALLDLMPRDWVTKLATRLRDAKIPFYAALNYNGIMSWSPAHVSDGPVTWAFNAHQATDKGLGPALGPTSARETAQIFKENGFDVTTAESPWKLGPSDIDLHSATLEGIADAARQTGNDTAALWLSERLAELSKTEGYIGHTDLLAIPRTIRVDGV